MTPVRLGGAEQSSIVDVCSVKNSQNDGGEIPAKLCIFITLEMIATACRVSYRALSFTNKLNHAMLKVQFGSSFMCYLPEVG